MLFLSVGAWAGTRLTRVLWRGLLLRMAWASNSCDKCSSHGDRGRFSQTNNGRMFICGSPHLGALCMFALVTGLCVLSFSQWFVCLSSPFSLLILLVFWFTEGQHLSTIQTKSRAQYYVSITCCAASFWCELCNRFDPVRPDTGLCCAPCFSA